MSYDSVEKVIPRNVYITKLHPYVGYKNILENRQNLLAYIIDVKKYKRCAYPSKFMTQ